MKKLLLLAYLCKQFICFKDTEDETVPFACMSDTFFTENHANDFIDQIQNEEILFREKRGVFDKKPKREATEKHHRQKRKARVFDDISPFRPWGTTIHYKIDGSIGMSDMPKSEY